MQFVKEVEQLMNEKNLNDLDILWKKLNDNHNHKINNDENQDKDKNSLKFRYKLNSKLWLPPNFAKLPILEYDTKSASKVFSMAYNEEERKNHNSSNVN